MRSRAARQGGSRRLWSLLSAALAGLSVLAEVQPARAADPEHNAPGWAFGYPGAEIAVASVCVASLSTALLPQRRGTWGAFASWEANPVYGRISDITGAFIGTTLAMTSGYFLEARYLELGGSPVPYARSFRSSLIDFEAVTLATGISYGIKRLAGRCRPRAWKEGRCGNIDTDYDAFPSGHTTPIAAVAGARFALAINSTGSTGLRFATFGIAEGMAVVTAFLRVGAGAHSWEDVLGGWILGHGTGLLLAYTHPMVDLSDDRPSETSQPMVYRSSAVPTVISWGGTF